MPKTRRNGRSSASIWSEHPLLVGIVTAILTAFGGYVVVVATQDSSAELRTTSEAASAIPHGGRIGDDPAVRQAPTTRAEANPGTSQSSDTTKGEAHSRTSQSANIGNVLPRCYARAGLAAPAQNPTREIFVFVDQTTHLDRHLTVSVRENVRHVLGPNTNFIIATFSATGEGRYPKVVSVGIMEPVPERRQFILRTGLRRLDTCLREQALLAANQVSAAIASALSTDTPSTSRSEIMDGLKQLSARVAASPARDRIVLVVSDMIENSEVASFYRGSALRPIDPLVELRNAAANRLVATFGGARVYVIGGGFTPSPSPVRDIRALNALEAFWATWIRQSNGRLVAFGRPDLVAPIE